MAILDLVLKDNDIIFTFEKFQKLLQCIHKCKEIIRKRVVGTHTYDIKRLELSEVWTEAKSTSIEFVEKFKPLYQTT